VIDCCVLGASKLRGIRNGNAHVLLLLATRSMHGHIQHFKKCKPRGSAPAPFGAIAKHMWACCCGEVHWGMRVWCLRIETGAFAVNYRRALQLDANDQSICWKGVKRGGDAIHVGLLWGCFGCACI